MFEIKVTVEILGLSKLIDVLSAKNAPNMVESVSNSVSTVSEVGKGASTQTMNEARNQMPSASAIFGTPQQQSVQTIEQPTVPASTSVPTTKVQYSIDDLAKAAVTLMDAGRQAELIQLLSSFGVNALPALPKEQYGAFATALRGMGAQI